MFKKLSLELGGKNPNIVFADCDFDEINWSESLPEERETLELLRSHGAKMSKELTV